MQACHAAFAFASEYPDTTAQWLGTSSNLVLLSAEDEPALAALADQADAAELRLIRFREPDLGAALTAVAIEPGGRSLCGALPLAMRTRR